MGAWVHTATQPRFGTATTVPVGLPFGVKVNGSAPMDAPSTVTVAEADWVKNS